MNPHYHSYSELTSSSPPPDNSSYHHTPPGGGGGNTTGQGGPPPSSGIITNGHPGMHPHHQGEIITHPHQHPLHHQQQHHGPPPTSGPYPPQHIRNNNNNNNMINNNTNNNVINNNNNGMGGMGSPTMQGGGPSQCGGCGAKIMDRFFLHALDRYWHNGCLKCSCCGTTLADVGTSCFTKNGMILCKTDYARLFGHSGACAGCGQTIPANELVMRAGAQGHVYHLQCFSCSKCQCQLMRGDRFCLLAGSLVCEQDWHKIIKGATVAGPGPLTPGTPGGPGTPTGPQPGAGSNVRKGKVGRPRRSRD